MKRIYLTLIMLAMIVATFSLTACSKDGDSPTGDDLVSQAVGRWMCTQSSDFVDGETLTGLMVGKQVTIRPNGTYESTSSSFGYSGTYSVSGNTITAKNRNDVTFVVNVTINGNRMTWSGTSSKGITFNYTFTKESSDVYDDSGSVSISLAGIWTCISSTNPGNHAQGLLKGDEITLTADGAYLSGAPSMGESGTYTLKGITITFKDKYGNIKSMTINNIEVSEMTLEHNVGSSRVYIYKLQRK